MNDINDPEGEIALCTLSAFNLGALENLDELENLADLIVRALDSLLDYQDYPIEAARIASMNFNISHCVHRQRFSSALQELL